MITRREDHKNIFFAESIKFPSKLHDNFFRDVTRIMATHIFVSFYCLDATLFWRKIKSTRVKVCTCTVRAFMSWAFDAFLGTYSTKQIEEEQNVFDNSTRTANNRHVCTRLYFFRFLTIAAMTTTCYARLVCSKALTTLSSWFLFLERMILKPQRLN